MKKTVKAALFAALVCFSSSLFAAEPVSFLKDTTCNLFEDETVDNLAWGLEDADGLVLGAYAPTNYNLTLAAGAWLGSMWFSVYEQGYFGANLSSNKEVTNDVVAKDGVNTDYVDVKTDTYNNRGSQNHINNNLFVSFSTGDWGVQSYWKLNDTTGAGKFGKETFNENDTDTGKVDATVTKRNKYNATNTFGAYFNGIGGFDLTDSNLYVKLNQFEVAWYNSTDRTKYSDSETYNEVVYTTDDKDEKKSLNRLTPMVEGEMGFDLPDLGSLATQFVLTETFEGRIGFGKDVTKQTTVTDAFDEKTTTKTTTTVEKGKSSANRFYWNNTLYPKFIFNFDAGERLSLKASAGASIRVYPTLANKPNYRTTITETTKENKVDGTTTTTYEKTVNFAPVNVNGTDYTIQQDIYDNAYRQRTEQINASFDAYTSVAGVYQVKPEKFNVNFGVEWNPLYFTWSFSKTVNQTLQTSSYTESTNAEGSKSVTTDSITYYRPEGATEDNGRTESKSTTFNSSYLVNSGIAAPKLNLGATWFVTDNATLDIAYQGTFGTGALKIMDGLLNSALKLQLAVKF